MAKSKHKHHGSGDDKFHVGRDDDWFHVGHHHHGHHSHHHHGHGHANHHKVLHVGANGEFQTIQSAVDAAQNGDTILVAAGIYAEQVTVLNKVLTIRGQGDATQIVAPPTLTANIQDTGSGTPSKNAIIGVEGGNVTIKGLSIDGNGAGDHLATTYGAADYNGIYYHNAGGEIENVSITGIRDPLHLDGSLSGNQRGNGIVVANRDGEARTVEVSHSTVADFQKTGMVFDGDGLTVDVDGNTVVGGGLQPLGSPAQNGIQVSNGATGTVDHNTVSDIGYGPDSWSATGILVYGSDNVVVSHNTVSMLDYSQDAGIAFIDADNPTAVHNDVAATYGIYQLGAFATALHQSHNHLGDSTIAVGFYPDSGGPFEFTGSRGDDEILGAGGNDILNGGRGDDALIGDGSAIGFGVGTGDDTFVFTKHSGNDTIWDFGQVAGNRDVMDVSGYNFDDFAELAGLISDNVAGDAVIQLTAHDSITVAGVHTADLTQSDFVV
jgi:hypothetical protein